MKCARWTGGKRFVWLELAVAALAAGTLCGCGVQQGVSPGGAGAVLAGRVHGGQQPVSGATIQLYAAGTGGYGTGAVALLTTPVTTAADGSFSITGDYTCPSASSEVYIVGTGGNPGLAAGTNNAALALMAAVGQCSLHGTSYTLDPNSFISVNEVTTVAAVYALRGFFGGSGAAIGTSAGNAVGLQNSFAQVKNLVDGPSGAALAVTPAGNGVAPQAVLNTLGDAIAPCVNSDGAGAACAALFAAATPSGGTAPSDTLRAMYNIASSPANNVAAVYGLVTPNAPFEPTLTSAPNDWTVQLQYSAYGSSQGGLAIDALGDVWVSNSFTSPTNLTSSVTEFSNTGTVMSGAAGFTGGGLNRPGSVSIDPAGNVWLANTFSGGVSEFTASGVAVSGSTGYAIATEGPIANDGYGNLWYASGIGAGKADSHGNVIPVASTVSGGLSGTTGISVDTAENVWVSVSVDEFTGRGTQVVFSEVQKFANDGTILSGANGYMQSGANYFSGIANDAAGDAWATSDFSLSPSVRKLGSDGTFLSGANGYTGGGLTDPKTVAIDGAGTAWVPGDYVASVGGVQTAISDVVAISDAGTFLSGAGGYVVVPPAGYPVGVAVDGSGDVWLCMASSVVVEMVGAGTPVVTPLALGVKNGTLGMRP